MKNVVAIILTLLLTTSAFAQNSVILDKGEAAPFSGILLTEDRAEKAVKAEKTVITLKALGVAQDALIDYHEQDATLTRRKLSEAKFNSYLNVLGAFVVGVLVTSLAFKATQKIGDM